MCEYCSDDTKDIFFEWLPALFGKETENHDNNLDMTVYIDDSAELVATVMFGDDILVKAKKPIKFCPFCGRKFRAVEIYKKEAKNDI